MNANRALGAVLLVWLTQAGLAPFQPRPAGAQDLAIRGGEVHTGSGTVLRGATVLVRNGRIAEAGIDVAIPAGVAVIDATGQVVTPGLIDISTSIGLVEVGMVSSSVDNRLEGDPVRAAFDVADGINPRSVLIPVNRSGGLTTVLTTPVGGLVSGQAAVIDLAGDSLEEILVRRTAAMVASFSPSSAGGARGGAVLRLRELFEDVDHFRRNRGAFDTGDSRHLVASRLDLEALVPVLEGELPLIVNVHRASDIEAMLRLAREFGIDLIVSGGSEAWLVADRLAAAGVPVVLKPLSNAPSGFDRLGARFDNAALLHRAGVDVLIGSFDSHNARWLTHEAGNAVRFGLPWEAALRAVTLGPAEALGLGASHGSIEPGKVANLVVWSGDPFELSSHPETVVIRGVVRPEGNRQIDLLDRYRYKGGNTPQ